MKSLIVKIATVGMFAVLLYVSTGCDGSRPPRKARKIKTSSEAAKQTTTSTVKKKRASDVGVGDVADYATGVTQLKTKQSSEKKLKNIYSDSNKELEKALQK